MEAPQATTLDETQAAIVSCAAPACPAAMLSPDGSAPRGWLTVDDGRSETVVAVFCSWRCLSRVAEPLAA